ncbi:Response regulator receiver domain protein (CheY) [Trichormus variabilis ATCC 29413]|uniref:Response regulator receiver domain protein (CheY) n=2 Tax=Anabaena variabilis TaxID=264691 RepID=Q3M7M7_TRIV2|nr:MULTISPECIES: response regulator [Nostocaceae]ABA23009.1 Response regulator receiver domain protein (CheY) [Trichormus variabilis ATCC 29413]MBC1215307.1 response regulator [Trichormus variabilis ARAD]MBC1256351.1 response regulator [Trichormus variabilis V5]MBC1268534.1 response regulator [Trichormus variabilis FSR]MBC1303972.1 response regulator [Trichormus variabilis N2B]
MNNQSLARGKVLIADDDEDSRMMLSFVLQEEGWEVYEACNGKEALEKVIEEKPDLLILDNRMPELSGVEVYQYLQAEGIHIAVVLATAYGYLDELASSLGVEHFIHKPYEIPALLKMVESAYAHSRN